MRNSARFRLKPVGLALCLALAYPVADGLPQGAQVVQGQVKVSTPKAGQGLIQQGSDKAVINWQSFSIGANESLRIEQPGVSSVLLNRVVGGDPSLILGRMQSNGQVFLLNPHGIVFGRGSQVDVGGLVASTLDLSDSAFLAGSYRFSAGPGAGGLKADGSINAPGGTVALLAPQLDVSGGIQARRVGLGAASTVQVDVEGDGLVLFNLRNDDQLSVALKFSGRIQAEGGSAELRAQARSGAAGQVLNMDGIVQARGLRQEGGRIVIDGGTTGDTLVNGTLDATGERGGSITVLGQRTGLLGQAVLDASGRLGGGDIQVGGGFHGEGTAHDAERTYIGAGAQLRADATEQGDGGRIAIWADLRTDFLGQVQARGGLLGGNGGMVETSGREQLNLPSGSVDVSAVRGRAGQWLLDPYDLTIKSATSSHVPGTASPFDAAGDDAVLDVGVLNNALASAGTVIVSTGSSGTQNGDISIAAGIVVGSGATLNLTAARNITVAGGGITGAGSVNMTGVAVGVDNTSIGGSLGIDATGGVTLGTVTAGALRVNSNGITQNGGLNITGAATLTSGSADITLGNLSAVSLDITTTSGAVTLGATNVGGLLKVTSTSGSLGQTGKLNVLGGGQISLGIGSATLSDTTNTLQGAFTFTGAAATVANTGSLTFKDTHLSAGLDASTGASGAIVQSGTFSTASTTKLTAGSGGVTLDGFTSGPLEATATGGTVQLDNGTVTGALKASGGTITQASGALVVTGTSELTATTISLGQAGNNLQGTVTLSSGSATLVNGSATTLKNTSLSGGLDASTTSGGITQTGTFSTGATTKLTAGAGNVTLSGFTSGALEVAATGGTVQLDNGTVTGVLKASGSTITQASGALIVTGTSELTATTISLGQAGNNLQDVVTLSGGSATLVNGSATTLKNTSLSGGLDASTTSGGITQSGTFSTGATTKLVAGSGGVTLSGFSSGALEISATGNAVQLDNGTVTGALKASGATITQSTGALTVTGPAELTGTTISLNKAGNDLQGAVTLSGGDATLVNGGSLALKNTSLSGGLDASTGAGGAITQSGTFSTVGFTKLRAGCGGVTLSGFSSGALEATSTGGTIQLDSGTVNGALKASGDSIAQATGGLVVTTTSELAGSTISLNKAGNNLHGAVTFSGGSATLVNGGALTLKDTSLTGGLDASTTSGGITQSGAFSTGGTTSLTAGSGGVTLNGFSSGALEATATGGTVRLDSGTVGGSLKASGSTIAQSTGALVVTGSSELTATTISLDKAGNSLQGAVTLGGGSASLANGGSLTLKDTSLSGTLQAATGSAGAIAQSGGFAVSGDVTLASGSGGITLGSFSSGGLDVSATGSGAISLGGGSVGGALLANTNGGDVTSSGAITVSGGNTVRVNARNGNVSLGNLTSGDVGITTAGNGTVTLAALNVGDLNVQVANGAINLGSGSIGGALTVTGSTNTTTSTVDQTGGLAVAGLTDINVGGAITLDKSANQWTGAVGVTGKSLALASTGSLTLSRLHLEADQAVKLEAGGNLNLGASASIDTGSADLTLASGGSFTMGGSLAGHNISLTADTSLTLGRNITAGGTLTLTTHSGTVLQNGGRISATGATTVSAASGAADITLDGTNNSFTGAVGLTGATVKVTNGSGVLSLGSSTVGGDLTLTSAGGIQQASGASLAVTGETVLKAANAAVTLDGTNNALAGIIDVTGGAVTLTTTGDLQLDRLVQGLSNQALVLDAGGVLTLPSGTGAINTGTAALTLSSRGGAFATFGTLTGGDVTVRGQTVDLRHNISASGNLEVQGTGGAIVQSGGTLNVTGTSKFDAGTHDVTIASSADANALHGAVALTGRDVRIQAHGALELGTATIGRDLTITSFGAITQSGNGLSVNRTASFNARNNGDITLTGGNAFGGAISLTGRDGQFVSGSVGAVTLGSVNLRSLVLAADGNVSQNSDISMTGVLSVDAGSGTINLSRSGNQLGGTVALKGGDTQVRTQGALKLGEVDVTGTLSVISTGAITQTTDGVGVTGISSFNAGSSADVTLTESANLLAGAVSLAGRDVVFRSNGAVTLGGVSARSLSLTAGGDVSQTSAFSMTGALSVTATGADIDLSNAGNQLGGTVTLTGRDVDLHTQGALKLGALSARDLTVRSGGLIEQSAALAVSRDASFNSGAADIDLRNAGNQLAGALSLTGRAVAIFNAPTLNFGMLSFSSLDATSNHSIILGTGALTGSLKAVALGGTITQNAGGLTVAGDVTLEASAGITMTDTANHLNGRVNLKGATTAIANAGNLRLGTLATGGLTVNATGMLDLGGGSVGGSLTATSSGGVTQTGALSLGGAASLTAGGGIELNQGGNSFAGIVDLHGGAVTINSSGTLALGNLGVGPLTAASGGSLRLGAGTVGGDLRASSGGAITQSAGGLSIGGTSTLSAAAGIQLNEGGNAFAGVVNLQGGDVSLVAGGALRLGSFATRDLSVSAGGDLDLGGGTASGVLTARTRGTRIGQSAPLTVQGLSNFIADGSLVTLVLSQEGNQLVGGINMRGENGGSFTGANISTAQDLSFSGDVKTVVLSTGGTLTLGGGHNETLSATAAHGIVLTGPLEVSGLVTLTAQGGSAVTVDLASAGAGNDLNQIELKSASGSGFGRVQIRDGDTKRHDGLRVSGDAASLEVTAGGTLDLGGGRYGNLLADTSATGAAIKQSGALTSSGPAVFKAGTGSVLLTRADNHLPSITVGSAGIASLVSATDYTVNASSVSTRLELAGPGAISLAGPLSGTGELVMSGSSSLTINSAQRYSGGTRIESGTVVLQGPAAKAGSGAVQLGAAGQLDLRDGASLAADLVAQGGTVVNGSGAGTLAGAVTLQATTTFLPGAGGLTITGAISDGGAGKGLRLDGTGTLTLAGSNQYSGLTDIASGTLSATGAGALPSTSAVQIAASGTLSLGQDQAIGSLAGAGRVELGTSTLATGADGRDTTFSGSLAGLGGLTKMGTGAFTLAGTGSHTGATYAAEGNLVLASAQALNDVTAVSVDGGAALTVLQSASLGSLAGSGTVDVQAALLSIGSNGGSTRFDGTLAGSGGFAKQGGGVFTLAGQSTLTGDVQVNAGTLQLQGTTAVPFAVGAPSAAGVLPSTSAVDVASGATLELLSDHDLGALTGSGRVLLNPYTLTIGASGRDSRFDGVISGGGSLTKAGAGTLTLGGANLHTGSTRVSGGTLALASAQALAIGSALVIDAPARVTASANQAVASLNGAGGLELNGVSLATGADGGDSRFDGLVTGRGGLVKQGAGTLTLTAAGSNSGATVIEAGTVRLAAQGSLGSGEIRNQGRLSLERGDAFTVSQAITGTGSLVITQGQVTLAHGGNSYSGATQVLGGSLVTTGADRLPDASAVQVAVGAQLQLGGNETVASLQAAGSVRLAGNFTTTAEQVYTGSLTLANPAGVTLSGTLIDASRSSNQFAGTPLGLNGGQALVTVQESLQLGDVNLANGGHIEADRLALGGKVQLGGGTLSLVATATPDDAKATPQGTAQLPVAGVALAVAEATVQQGNAGAITVAGGARLQVQASGGGSVLMGQDANSFKGQLSVLSGTSYNTAWTPNAKGGQGIQSLVRVSGQQVMVGGSGIEADMVYIRADQLATADGAKLVARLPFDEIVLGKALSAPSMTLELAPGAFGVPGSFGTVNGQPIQVEVGSTLTGNRTTGPNAGYLAILPKAGAQGATAVVLVGPKVGSQEQGGAPYRFFHDGASQATEIPVVYNGVLPLTPSASGAISSINGDAEDARRARFQETVRTENVTVRLRSGVIAEVGPGRASTQGSEGAKPPELCDPAAQPALSCKPPTP